MMMLLALPILMLVLFGFAITTEVKNAHIAIYDPSNDAATRAIGARFGTSEYFKVVAELRTPEEIDGIFRFGDVSMVVVFGDGFYENLVRTGDAQVLLIADGTDPNTASTLVNYASAIVSSYQQELSPLGELPYRIHSEVRLLYNPRMKGAYNFVPGVMGMVLMLICAMMTSISIAREKEKGTMEILLVSPMKPIVIILAKTIPYFVLSVVNLATILIMSVFVLEVPIAGSLPALVTVSLVFIFASLALGLLISSAVQTQVVALLISGMALMMPVILLSGMMFPVENMPRPLQWFSRVLPASWYIVAVRKIMIKGLGLASILKELSVLAGMALALIVVSLKRFRIRLE